MSTYKDDDDAEEKAEQGGRSSVLGDSLRKIFSSGLNSLLVSEESLRNSLAEMRLPKEAMAYVMQQTERSRKELFRAMGDELRDVMKGMQIDVSATVRFSESSALESKTETTFKTKVHTNTKSTENVSDSDISTKAGDV